MTKDTHDHDHDHGLVEEVDLEACTARGEKPPRARAYLLRVDDRTYCVKALSITGREVAALAEKPSDVTSIQLLVRGKKPRTICPDQKVDLTTVGIECFVTRPGVTFTIDQEERHSTCTTLTVREILREHAGVDPSLTTLVEMRGDEPVKHPDLDETLPLRQCERFVVFHNTPTPVS